MVAKSVNPPSTGTTVRAPELTHPAPTTPATNGTLTIPAAAKYLGITDMRMRTLLREHRVEAVKRNIPGTETPRWEITQAALDAYRTNRRPGGSARPDGRSAVVIYVSPAERTRLAAWAEEQGIPAPTSRNGTKTPEQAAHAKAYRKLYNQKKRQAAKVPAK